MVNKEEIAQLFNASVGQMVDSMRYFHVFGTIDDAAVLVSGGTATYLCFHTSFKCKLVSCIVRAEILETADGTIDVVKADSGTAISGGTDLITQIVPTAAGGMVAATDYTCTVLTASAVNEICAGCAVAIVIGTVGELSGIMYDLKFERMN